jgi:hypothetical protein
MASPSSLRARLQDWLLGHIRASVHRSLAPRRAAHQQLQLELDELRRGLLAQRRFIEKELQRLDRSPVDGSTTVHAAHQRHPKVQEIFASYGLPGCLDCAVGAEESLQEAAFGEELPADVLIGRINALLLSPG